MKTALLLTFIFNCLSSFSQNSVRKDIDVQRYIFDITLTDNDDTIKCIATIQVKIIIAAANIYFDLTSIRPDGKGMKVLAITENSKSLSFNHTNNVVRIDLPTPTKPGEERTFEVVYKGIPADGLVISKNKYNHRTFFADNWPNRGHNWLACVDHPSDKAAVDFIVRAPLHYRVVSNGVLVEESNIVDNLKLTHWHESVQLPTKVMVIGVADFAVNVAGNIDCIPVSSWIYPEERQKGFDAYGQAMEILPFFIAKVGPYPYKKLANVQSKTIFGGMENASAIFYYENSISGEKNLESLLAHEIAHQWFGDMATETDWPHVWLSEGFATYMADIFQENKYGPEKLRSLLTTQRLEVIAYAKKKFRPIVDTLESDYMELLNTNSYQKGAWILHMLRRQLGDSVFWKGIRNYYSTYAGKNASTDDLRKIMENTSGKNLAQFFHQWLLSAGHPILAIQWKFDADKKILIVTVEQQQQQLFEFPLNISIKDADGSITKSIYIKEKRRNFNIPMSSKPQQFNVDPNVSLLFEGNIKESK